MSATPIWFRGRDCPIFGWLHVPDSSMARAGVVIAPSLAVEAMSAHPAERLLANDLCDSGIAVLRFDYPGTGDSAGNLAELPAEAFTDSVGEAIALLRSLGARRIGVSGLRFGAIVAAACAAGGGVDSLALWDPSASGRAYLREQRALKQLSIGETIPPPDGALELLGMCVPTTQAEHLSKLSLAALEGPLATRVLVLARNDRPAPVGDPEALARVQCDVVEVDDLSAFIDVLPDDSVLPTRSLAELHRFFDTTLGADARPFARPEPAPAVLTPPGAEVAVTERAVVVGERKLFGIITEPEPSATGPTVIFLNAGLLHHIGPARLWVDLARQLALCGQRSIRFDLSGLGDSGNASDQGRQVSYPLQALDDIATVSRFVAPLDGREVIYVGLCAGAYHSIEAGIANEVLGACAINPILNFEPPEMSRLGAKDPMRQAVHPYNPLFRTLRRNTRLRDLGERVIPPWLWWMLDRTGLQPSPGRGLEALVQAGVDVLLVCGEVEARPFRQRARATMRRLTSGGRLRFEVLPDSDHTLFGADARTRATELVMAHVLRVGRAHGVSRTHDPGTAGSAKLTAAGWRPPIC